MGNIGPSADADTHREAETPTVAFNHFARGAQACREMMARFVAATHPDIATSIRLNWHPGWGGDPGQPPFVVDTWEPAPCPEGEASYTAYQAAEHDPEPNLAMTATMLETWGPVVEPASPDGRISFARSLMASAAETIRAHLKAVDAEERVACDPCAGSGWVEEEARTTGANQHSACRRPCDDCEGSGHAKATTAPSPALGGDEVAASDGVNPNTPAPSALGGENV